MINDFAGFLSQASFNAPFPERIKGYNEDEISKIEGLFDIKIAGEMKLFFQIMGRCSGGLINDSGFNIYKKNTLRVKVLGAHDFVQDLRVIERMIFIKKPFFLACENETQDYFCLTDDDGKYQVYCYDENEEEIFETGFTFGTYMMKVSEEGKRNWENLGIEPRVYETDLLEI